MIQIISNLASPELSYDIIFDVLTKRDAPRKKIKPKKLVVEQQEISTENEPELLKEPVKQKKDQSYSLSKPENFGKLQPRFLHEES